MFPRGHSHSLTVTGGEVVMVAVMVLFLVAGMVWEDGTLAQTPAPGDFLVIIPVTLRT